MRSSARCTQTGVTRRELLRTIGVVGAGCAVAGAARPTAARMAGGKAGPNVLLILVDDLGNRSLSCFGSIAPTPNLDKLAKGGMVFRNAHAAPMCAATRDEMMTGLYRAAMCGTPPRPRMGGRPGAQTPFFTNHLQKRGYATGMAGKWFVGCAGSTSRASSSTAIATGHPT